MTQMTPQYRAAAEQALGEVSVATDLLKKYATGPNDSLASVYPQMTDDEQAFVDGLDAQGQDR